MVQAKDKIRNILTVAVSAALLSVTITTASAHASDWAKAFAPIRYKGSNPYATGYRPAPTQQMTPQMQAPQYGAPQQQYAPQPFVPQPRAPQLQAALPQPSAPSPYTNMAPRPLKPAQFNPNGIDRNLYKHQKVGNPYTVLGQTYYPQHDPSYDRTGVASWYGDKFHGKLTANGETFDKNAMTAAHPTLPLNSYVYVTNLQTGQYLKVRLNDRGPFIGNRLIDLSEAAAEALGVRQGGLSQVRVQYAGPSESNGSQQAYTHAPTPRATAPVPVRPAPMMPAPRMVAPRIAHPPVLPRPQAQQPQAPVYQPLRQQVAPPAQYAALPQAPRPMPVAPLPTAPQMSAPGNVTAAPSMLGLQLPKAPIAIPEASIPQSNDGSVVTLTIKGPIHMAGMRDTFPQNVYITGPYSGPAYR